MATSDEIKATQRSVWGGVAGGWDKWYEELERHSRPINEWLCRAAKLSPGMRLLDLACGSGQPALSAALLVRPGGSVVATDIAPEMVDVTRRKAQAAGVDNLEARVMDMEEIDFPDASFDAVTCRWGFMFPPDPVKAMAESRRVLRPGGRLVAAVWDVPARNPWLSNIPQAVNQVQPAPPADPDAPGPFRLAEAGRLETLLRQAGFASVEVEQLPFVHVFDSLEAWWSYSVELAAPIRARFLALGAADRERAKQIAFAAAEKSRSDGEYRLAAANLCAVAQK